MDEEQGLSSPIERGIRGIRRSISSNIFGGRRAPQIQGDGVSADIIARNSLALSNVANQLGGISEQVNNINSSLTAIKDNLSISDEIEKKKELAKRRREAQLAINEALKNQNNLTNQYATLLKTQFDTTKEITADFKDRVKVLNTLVKSTDKNKIIDTRKYKKN